MRYTVIIEQRESRFGAFVPDLPGCIAAAATRDEAMQLIKDAIAFHIEGLIADGESVPEPHCDFTTVEIDAA